MNLTNILAAYQETAEVTSCDLDDVCTPIDETGHRGWTEAAINQSRQDIKAFVAMCALTEEEEGPLEGLSDNEIGMGFWLARNETEDAEIEDGCWSVGSYSDRSSVLASYARTFSPVQLFMNDERYIDLK